MTVSTSDVQASNRSGGLQVDGVQVIGKQEPAIADITPAADGTTAGTAVNDILAMLRLHGIIAT